VRQSERYTAILDRLARDGSVSAVAVAEEFGVSMPTVRRDLQRLEEQRLLTRTHGGAVSQDVSYELPLRYRSARHYEQKSRIAAAAVGLLGDVRSVGLTGGTTTTEVARALSDRPQLTVVTNALNIALDLAVRPNIKLVLTGGVARAESFELVGALAEATLAGLHLDVAVIGADGVDIAAGLTTHHEVEAHTNRALIASARRAIAVADASKLGRVAFASICPLALIDVLVTDAAAPAATVAALRDAGLEVVLA
jgi:DeoR family transcriptional regulator of aga operon